MQFYCPNFNICYTFFVVIDWLSLIFNASWIIGLALLLAAFSYHYWEAGQERRPLREQLSQPSFSRLFWISFTFITVGLAGTSQRLWETAIWLLFVIVSVAYTFKFSLK